MENSNDTLHLLKQRGHRLTKVRRAVVDIFFAAHGPLSVQEIISLLKRRALNVNKTTVYRELEFFIEQNLLREIDLLEGMKRYELLDDDGHHHHHVLCLKCKNIQCVDMDRDLDLLEKHILDKYNFSVVSHTLEFFGVCANCRK